MVLLENFFKILKEEKGINEDFFYLQLNSEHEIYQVHFPNNPITPGVCLLQILKEIVKKYYFNSESITITSVKNIKFINPINPLENNIIMYQINFNIIENSAIINSTVFDEYKEKTFVKMKLEIKK